MRTPKLPRMSFHAHGQLGDTGWHTILISLLRGLAAIEVTAAHLRADLYPGMRTISDPSLWFKGFAFITGFAHHAVLVFFVISGWLVGGSLLDKFHRQDAISGYAIDRVTRLWTVLIPTFLLTLLFGLSTNTITAQGLDYSAANEYSALAFAANLFGLQTIVAPPFGGNFPLWSLANETWYYVLFPLIVVVMWSRRTALRVACAVALAALCVVLPGALVGYFAVWLLGVLFSRITIDCGGGWRVAALVLVAAMWSFYRLTGNMDAFDFASLMPDLVCSLAFLLLLSSLRFKPSEASRLSAPLARTGTFFADFSFSLYVLHVPMIALLKHWILAPMGLSQLSPHEPLHFALYLALLAMLIGGAYLSYLLFESRTYRIRALLKRLLLQRPLPASVTPAVRAD